MAQPTEKQKPVLDLNTLTDRQMVRIDGQSYPLRNPEELSFLNYDTQAKKFTRLGELLRAKSTPKVQKEQHRLLDELTRVILEAPDAVHRKLRDPHRAQIVSVFSQLLRRVMRLEAGANTARPPTRRK